jgi:uncharacterized protein YdcH (DUF465 family)
MTINQLNELLNERDELQSRIRQQECFIPKLVREAIQDPEVLEFSKLIIERNNLNYRIAEAERLINNSINNN